MGRPGGGRGLLGLLSLLSLLAVHAFPVYVQRDGTTVVASSPGADLVLGKSGGGETTQGAKVGAGPSPGTTAAREATAALATLPPASR